MDGMTVVELQRNRSGLVGSIVWTLMCALVLGSAFFAADVGQAVVIGVVALGGMALGVGVIRSDARPFRFGIGPDGLTIRTPQLNRTVAWAEISALVVERVPPHIDAGFGSRLVSFPNRGRIWPLTRPGKRCPTAGPGSSSSNSTR